MSSSVVSKNARMHSVLDILFIHKNNTVREERLLKEKNKNTFNFPS